MAFYTHSLLLCWWWSTDMISIVHQSWLWFLFTLGFFVEAG